MPTSSDDDMVGCRQALARNQYGGNSAKHRAYRVPSSVHYGDYDHKCWEKYIGGLLSEVRNLCK